ncbi:PREDICTED: thioredoxin Y1, chloroplastic [Tarenaya hassleriana]|uniref:thioredoxin Y1, chloroplastic n=1 Tax=Tarenaya hassleriana TaxID=28532 RepID=UPI00053C7787|nr:PREDICTED: thioredoxin Y1, chloroplastic [Tarenaya hassleriana]
MAISPSASAISLLNSQEPCRITAFDSKDSRSFLLAGSPLQVLRIRTGDLRISYSSSRPRSTPLAIKAKKQTYDSFEDLLVKSEKPILVDFYATWCGPCLFMVPILNEVSTILGDKIQVVKIDTEKYPSIANKYRIEALPTFILFKDGTPCDRFEGALTARQLIQRIENSLEVKQ